MTNDEIKEYITGLQPSAGFEETGEWLNVLIEPGALRSVARSLRHSKFQFDYLFCLTCVDWKTHLTMVYHLASTFGKTSVVLKSNLDRSNPVIDTLSDIWRTAEFHEREVYEMFGVQFTNHPDLRLLILPDDWTGKAPLRKDFEDPVNMIKL